MCSIIGLKGYTINDIKVTLDLLSHRGSDARGLYYNNKLYKDEEIDNINDDSTTKSLILAHNLLSIIGNNEVQPLTSDKLVLVSNAEIYNYKALINYYNMDDIKTNSDCEIILKVIEHYYNGDLKQAVLKSLEVLDGDYAFCIYDNNDYMIVRDRVGVKPLYYSIDGEKFAFASEKKALKKIGCNNIQDLNPRYALYNGELIRIYNDYQRTESHQSYESLKKQLKDALTEAVYKRVNGLDDVALLFSAGVDSTLIAAILKHLGVNVTLYTVGTQNSQDLKKAKEMAKQLDLTLNYKIITQADVEAYFFNTKDAIEDDNLMKIGVGMTINMTSRLASLDGHKVILSGQGADELFCGYNRYKKKYDNPEQLLAELSYDLNNMYHVNLERDDKATMNNSIELRVPFMDKNVIEIATKIPVKYMLKSGDDNIRKHILRDVAMELKVPEDVAYRPKKAAQYGTGIDKIIRKKLSKKEPYKTFIEESRRKNRRK